jgi:putative ABC transport system ATP-binding protein
VVVVTHEEDIAAFTERIIRFRDGKLVSDTTNEPQILTEEEAVKMQKEGRHAD